MLRLTESILAIHADKPAVDIYFGPKRGIVAERVQAPAHSHTRTHAIGGKVVKDFQTQLIG